MATWTWRTGLLITLVVGRASAGTADTCIDASESGQVERDRGHFQAAKKLLQACAKEACPGEIRKDCATWLDALDRRIPSIVVRVVDADGREVLDATVSIDGAAAPSGGIAVPLDPGDKTVRVVRAGQTLEQTVRVVEGERARVIEVKLDGPRKKTPPVGEPAAPAAPAGGGVPAASYALGGVALLAAGGYAYFGLHAKSEVDDMRATCAPTCDASRVDAARRDRNIANVLFGVSALSLGGALYLALGAPPKAAQRVPALSVTATHVGAVWDGRF